MHLLLSYFIIILVNGIMAVTIEPSAQPQFQPPFEKNNIPKTTESPKRIGFENARAYDPAKEMRVRQQEVWEQHSPLRLLDRQKKNINVLIGSVNVVNGNEAKSENVVNGYEAKSENVVNGNEAKSENVVNVNEAKSKNVVNGYEAKSENVVNENEAKSENVVNGNEVKSSRTFEDNQVINKDFLSSSVTPKTLITSTQIDQHDEVIKTTGTVAAPIKSMTITDGFSTVTTRTTITENYSTATSSASSTLTESFSSSTGLTESSISGTTKISTGSSNATVPPNITPETSTVQSTTTPETNTVPPTTTPESSTTPPTTTPGTSTTPPTTTPETSAHSSVTTTQTPKVFNYKTVSPLTDEPTASSIKLSSKTTSTNFKDGNSVTEEYKSVPTPENKVVLPTTKRGPTPTTSIAVDKPSTYSSQNENILENRETTESDNFNPDKSSEKKWCLCNKENEENKVTNEDLTDIEFAYKMLKDYKPPVTSQRSDQKHYRLADYIVQYIFKHYPEYQVPLLSNVLANNTKHQAYSGMVMEFQQPNNYDILLTDSYSQVNDGSSRSVEQYPSLYQCSKAIRYCSINPKFCQYQEGDYDTNIIIVVPHGGNVKPHTIPERTPGCFIAGQCLYAFNCGPTDSEKCSVVTRPERYSKKMALKLAYYLKNVTGQRPHVIIMDLHRSIIDVDRRQEEGAYDDVTRSAWYDFHNFISLAKQKIRGKGLLIDVHSHLHKHGLVELSYAVTKSQLLKKGRYEVDMRHSSLRSLVETNDIDSESILRGNLSLGSLLQNRKIESVPSPDYPEPRLSGYTEKQTITRLYGSLYGGSIDSLRVSVPKKYGRKKQAKIFSDLLADAVKEFMDVNYVK